MKVIVPDMNCGHCVAKIQKSVLTAGVAAKVNLADKSVEFPNVKDQEKVVSAILDAGYHPKV